MGMIIDLRFILTPFATTKWIVNNTNRKNIISLDLK